MEELVVSYEVVAYYRSTFHRRRSRMDSFVETSLEPRKNWATPELKKIDIDQITAAGGGFNDDGNGVS